MAEILDQVRDALEGPIDFEGQRLAEQLNTNFLSIVGLIALLIGYFTHNIYYTLWSGLGGTVLAFLLIVPPWPFFNQHRPKWLPAKNRIANSIQVSIADNK